MSAINALLDEQPSDGNNFCNVLQIEAAGRSLVLTVGRLLDSLETLKYISEATTDVTAGADAKAAVSAALEEKDINLWDEEGEAVTGDNNTFKAGTLNAVVTRLTSDTNYGVYTYPSY